MSQSQIDLEAFRNFERATHDKLAGSYYDAFSAVTDRAIEPLLKATCVENETRLLDVATGPGTLAAKAAERGARVIGIDIAPAMIALAHSLHPHLDFREGSAEELLFAPSSFDAVVSSFGVGHFSRPERVLSEFARVLVPKGRVALAWWDGFGKNRINGMFFEAINELGISAPGALPAGPAVDRFSDPDQFAAILRAADFEVVGIDYISFAQPLKTVDELWNLALASCGYLPLFLLRAPKFSKGFETRWSRWRGNMRRQMVCKFRLPLELSPDFGEVCTVRFGSKADILRGLRDVRFTPKSGH
jgi:SAM-dependent methyltransferase